MNKYSTSGLGVWMVSLMGLFLAGCLGGLRESIREDIREESEELREELREEREEAAAAAAGETAAAVEEAAAAAAAETAAAVEEATAAAAAETAAAVEEATAAAEEAAAAVEEAAAAVEDVLAANNMVGRTIKDCDVCPTMIVVPGGNFVMGAPPGEQGRDESEGPQHMVEVPRAFAVGVYEVTFAEWEACVNAQRCGGLVPEGGGPGMESHPVVNVSWQDIEGYLEWLTEATGNRYRLLTEAEWEYVARASTQTSRYWGPTAADQCRYANGADGEAPCSDGHAGTGPVGLYFPNEFGLHDVLGNVWEWTQDCWNIRLVERPEAGARLTGNCARRVVRGGSAFDGPNAIRAASRGSYPAAARVARVGFRVARSLN